ncbi:hypothetical protein LUB14_16335, partial [Klebsiella pneumoniae]|uniref:hypothetical protein n=1 Tax=Klebsiella pneumoniae TaxID=573 RepID=UPI001E3040D8
VCKRATGKECVHMKMEDGDGAENPRTAGMGAADVKKSRRLEIVLFFFFQTKNGIRDQPRSRGLGDVYKRQIRLSCNTKY